MSRIQLFHEAKQLGKIPHQRAKSKQKKDQTRYAARLEKQRLFSEAHYDQIDSPGEVDALTSSVTLGVERAEVLRDPKLRYLHPSLRDW